MKTKRSPAKAAGLKGGAQADGMQDHALGSAATRAGGAEAAPLVSEKPTRAKKKWPVPLGLIWWKSLIRHPLNEAMGMEVFVQRTRRGWSLDEVHDATGISKSHLWNIEHGLHTLGLDMILALERVFGMVPGGLRVLAERRLRPDGKGGMVFCSV